MQDSFAAARPSARATIGYLVYKMGHIVARENARKSKISINNIYKEAAPRVFKSL